MRKEKTFLKVTSVLLIAITLFLSTVVTADILLENNELHMDSSFVKITNINPSDPIIEPFFGPVIFQQPPSPPDISNVAYTSATNMDWICADDFWNITEPICDIHWWGFSLLWNMGWTSCNPAGMEFEIIFYDADLNPVCVYSDLIPTPVMTGVFYGNYELIYWETCLNPCCDISDGWVSIQSTYSPTNCSFLWLNSQVGNANCMQNWEPKNDNLAFELTSSDVPEICCDPVGMNFGKRPSGSTVNAKIYVYNCGNPCSFLDWYIDTANVPKWGTWTFSPINGNDILDGTYVIVNVTCKLTRFQGNYTGNITVYNTNDPSDFCVIGTSVDVPRTRTVNHPMLLRLFERFPLLERLLFLFRMI